MEVILDAFNYPERNWRLVKAKQKMMQQNYDHDVFSIRLNLSTFDPFSLHMNFIGLA